MDYLVTILCTMSGALMGTATGTFMMFRRLKPEPSEVELNMWRETLRTSALDQDKLRKQIAERDRSLRELADTLN